jgi:hypothetical protein
MPTNVHLQRLISEVVMIQDGMVYIRDTQPDKNGNYRWSAAEEDWTWSVNGPWLRLMKATGIWNEQGGGE